MKQKDFDYEKMFFYLSFLIKTISKMNVKKQ